MEIALVLLALAAVAWYFFRNKTRRGLEIVRAQVFLSGLHSGHTTSDANYAASFGFKGQLPPEVIQSAAALSKAEYGRRTFPIIAEAYRRGMKPRLPLWQRMIVLGSVINPQKDVQPQVTSGATPHRHALNLY
ncbi:MAG: hypothetical protein ABL865_07325, partial [Candidatus Nitrotoga sp.]